MADHIKNHYINNFNTEAEEEEDKFTKQKEYIGFRKDSESALKQRQYLENIEVTSHEKNSQNKEAIQRKRGKG